MQSKRVDSRLSCRAVIALDFVLLNALPAPPPLKNRAKVGKIPCDKVRVCYAFCGGGAMLGKVANLISHLVYGGGLDFVFGKKQRVSPIATA